MTLASVDRVLADVLDHYDTSAARQEIVWTIQHGIPLAGESAIAGWQERAAVYPPALGRAMVEKHIAFDPWWPVEMYARRGDVLLAYEALSQALRRIVAVLCGLNRRYYPGLKWLDRTIEEMPLHPTELSARIQHVFQAEPVSGGELMRQLVEETLSLVEQQMPEVDVAQARESFRYQRPVLNEAPVGG
jgi:hypothetical protein